MKNLKKSLISLVTAVAMIASMTTSMITASAEYIEEKVLYSNDLESGKTLDKTTTVADPTDSTNNVAKYNAGWAQPNIKLSEPVSSGIVQVKFDYMANATNSSFHVDLAADRVTKNFLTFLRRGGTTIEGAGDGTYGTVEIGKWYTIDTVVDLDTKHYTSVVKDKATGTVIANVDTTLTPSSREFKDWPEAVTEFTDFFFQGGSAEDYLDNILVRTLVERPVEKVLYSNDLESGKTLDKTTTVADPTDSTNNVAKYNAGWAQPNIKLSEPVSSGIVQVKFDYMANATNSSFHVDLAADRVTKNFLTFLRRGGTTIEGAGDGTYGTVEIGKWYTIDTVVNLDTKHYMSVVKDRDTGNVLNSIDVTLTPSSREFKDWPETVTEFTDFFFQGGSAEDYLDNILVKTLLEEPAPEPEEKVLYSNDLESDQTLDKTTTVTDPTDSANNVAKYNAGWAQPNVTLSEAVSSGIVQVKFDYMANATNSSFHVDLIGADGATKNFLTLIRRGGTTIEGAGEGTYGTVEIGKWYTIDTVINLDTKHYMSVVKDRDTGNVLNSVEYTLTPSSREFKDWPETVNEFTKFFFQGGSAEDYLDNILVKTLAEEPELPKVTERELYSNDLESGKTLDKTTTVADPTDSTNNVAKYNAGWVQPNVTLSEAVSSGIVQVKFDYMANATNSSFHVELIGTDGATKNFLTLIRRGGTTLEGAGDGTYGTVEIGKWYTIDTVVNLDTKHYMSVVKDRDTGNVLNSVEYTLTPSSREFKDWPETVNEFTKFFFQGGSAEDYLDNILVKTLAEEPELPKVTERVLYSNDLESGKTLDKTTTVADPTDSTNNVAKYNAGWAQPNVTLSEAVSSGIIEVKFDYMANATNSSFHVDLIGADGATKNFLTLIRRGGTTIEGAGEGTYGTVEIGKWYTIDTVVNLDTKHYMSVVKDKATGKVLKSIDITLTPSSREFKDWPETVNEFTKFFFQGGSAEDYLDNILVKTLAEEPEMEQEDADPGLLYSNDFQSGSAPANGTINTDNENKYLTLNGGWTNIQYKFNKVTTDKIKVTFDFMNTASNSTFYAVLLDSSVSNSDGTEFLNLLRDEKKMECYSSTQNRNILGDHVENEWLTYEALVDINTKYCISTVYNKATGEAIATVEVALSPSGDNLADWPKTATGFDTFMIASGRTNGTHIDNLLIEKVVGAPTVSADKITIKDSKDEVQSVWTDVSPDAKTFHIDFGTAMDESTVTKDTVYITEKDSTTPLSATVGFVDGIAVLTLGNGQLKQSKEYVLHISGTVENVIGEALGEDTTYSFIVNAGEISAVMGTPVVGATSNPSFASLNAGDVVKVPVTYLNTTGEDEDVNIIVAYYKNNGTTLAHVEFIDVPFNKDVMNAEYTFEHTFKTITDADALRVMIWDGFDTLVPLSASVEIK